MSALLLRLQDMRIPLRFGETLLGRSPYCSIVLSDPQISRQHAALRVTSEGLSIEDLGSRNGTRVNGEALRGKRRLVPGDSIELGSQVLSVELTAREDRPARRTLSTTLDRVYADAELEAPTHPGGEHDERTVDELTVERPAPHLPNNSSAR